MLRQLDDNIEASIRHFTSDRSTFASNSDNGLLRTSAPQRRLRELQKEWEGVRKAAALLKRELEEDEWMVVVRS